MSFTKSPRLCSQRKNTSRFPPTPKCSTACCSTGCTFPPKTAGRTSVGASTTDKRGRIYQFFTVKEAQEKLRFGHEKICRLFSELEQADLILRKRQGQGKPNIIYLKKF